MNSNGLKRISEFIYKMQTDMIINEIMPKVARGGNVGAASIATKPR